MNFRLKTNENTALKLKYLQSVTGLKPNILSRLSISLSLQIKAIPVPVESEANGIEFNRNTLTGEHDYVYKTLIKQHANSNINENDYFPNLFNAHLTRGAELLEQEYLLAGNFNKFLQNLLSIATMNQEGEKNTIFR